MQFCTLGNTDLQVSRVAFGCWAIIGGFNWGPQDEADSLAALRAAFDAGITLFDSAEGYGGGASEQLIAKALGDVRDEIVIATKVSPRHFLPDELRAACERSLKNLGTDRIDLYQLHWPNRDIPIAETLGVLRELQTAGKVHHVGVSNFGLEDLSDLLTMGGQIASNQLAYNLLFRAIEFEILPLCMKQNISVLCYSPIMQGLLAGKFGSVDEVPEDRARTRHFTDARPETRHGEPGAEAETFAAIDAVRAVAAATGESMADVALAWLLAQDGVGCVIAGGRNAEQAERNARAADVQLPPEVVAQLAAVTDALKQMLGPNADLWQGAGNARMR